VSNLAAVTDQTFAAEVLKAPAAIVDFWAEW
jgi:thioredoxin-like negative regulator of GroEL